MNERDVRILFESGHWQGANVIRDFSNNGWKVCLIPTNTNNVKQILETKRGIPRIFKTSDAAIHWCKDIGFTNITAVLNATYTGIPDIMMKKHSVLLIEDNDDDVELTLRAFSKNSFQSNIEVIQDGQKALNYILAREEYDSRNINDVPSLILLDINLPKISGLEILKEIRANPATQFIPVILLTTSDELEDVIKGYQLGSNSYINKPVNFEVFADVIKELSQYWLQVNTPPPSPRVSQSVE